MSSLLSVASSKSGIYISVNSSARGGGSVGGSTVGIACEKSGHRLIPIM